MRLLFGSLVAAASVLACGAATAQGNDDFSPGARGLGGVQVGDKPRVVAMVDGDLSSFNVVRGKGLGGVTRPTTGVYCIEPAASIDTNKAVAFTTVDFANSENNPNVAVQWRSSGIGCPAGQFTVHTRKLSSGTFVFSNEVGFTFMVP